MGYDQYRKEHKQTERYLSSIISISSVPIKKFEIYRHLNIMITDDNICT